MSADERVRERWARAPRTVAPGCPEPGRLFAGASGELPAAEVSKIVDHLRVCGACSEDWRLARELHGPVASAAPGKLVMGPRRWWVAAAIGLPLAAVALLTLRTEPVDDPMRAVAEPGASTAVVAEGTSLPRDQLKLEWTAGPANTWYILTVTDRRLAVLYTSGPIESASHLVPVEELRGVKAGEELFWQVESLLPEGGHARSSTFRVVVQ